MIYSTNRTASIGEVDVEVNESYFGAGALMFGQECAQDELAIFEAAVKSDIDECIIGESAYELQSLNEGFIENAKNKIKELWKKFIAWLDAVMRSAIAKLTALFVRDNEKFVKIARKQIAKMKNKGKFEYSGEYITTNPDLPDLNPDAIFSKCNVTGNTIEDVRKALDAAEEWFDETFDMEKFKEAVVKDGDFEGQAAFTMVNEQIKILEDLSRKEMKKLKDDCNKAKKKASEAAKKAENKLNKLKDDATPEARLLAETEVECANTIKSITQKGVAFMLKAAKMMGKVARKVVAKAMGASPKNEGYFESEEMMQAMIESVEFEYDEALEEMSEATDEVADDDFEDIDEE